MLSLEKDRENRSYPLSVHCTVSKHVVGLVYGNRPEKFCPVMPPHVPHGKNHMDIRWIQYVS